MKRKLALLLSAVILLPLLASCGRRKLDEPIELIIANDIHYISPSLLSEDGSIAEGAQYSRDGKVVHYVSEITDAFLSEVIEKKPKALLIAGDLTLSGARTSHDELVGKLTAVKEAGVDILVIPGNHDVDKTAVDYSGEELKETESLDSTGYAELYAPLMPDTVSRDSESQSFVYEAGEKLWVLMLDTNIYGQGFAKDSTLEWTEEMLSKAQSEGIDVIAVSHQNLYAHSDMLSFGYQMYNADKLIELYKKYGVVCNFSGHIHIQSIIDDEELPEIATSALSITGLHYGKITYNGKQIEYSAESVNVSAYAESIGAADENLLRFTDYATEFFESTAMSSAKDSLVGQGLSEADIDLMANTYAKINSAYFEGRAIDASLYEDGLALWRSKSDSFIARYIESMLSTCAKDHRQITIKLK